MQGGDSNTRVDGLDWVITLGHGGVPIAFSGNLLRGWVEGTQNCPHEQEK